MMKFETELYYDDDNFSGRYNRRNMDDYIYDDGYIDDPNDPPNDDEDEEEWIGDKDKENEYSWYQFDNYRPISPGFRSYSTPYNKTGVNRDIDTALNYWKYDKEWTDSEINRGRANMNAWVHHPEHFSNDDVGDSWEVFKMMHPHKKTF